jgi:hypothetical protein
MKEAIGTVIFYGGLHSTQWFDSQSVKHFLEICSEHHDVVFSAA